jgi:hypothetical protein
VEEAEKNHRKHEAGESEPSPKLWPGRLFPNNK